MNKTVAKRRQGFACLDRARIVELARKGAATAHARGTAHKFTLEENRAGGRTRGSMIGWARYPLYLKALRSMAPVDNRPLYVRALESRGQATP